jgi:hypothetical protein
LLNLSLSLLIYNQYALFGASDGEIHTITVEGGYYPESSWEVPPGKTVVIKGKGKDETFVTCDGVIMSVEGMLFFFFFF